MPQIYCNNHAHAAHAICSSGAECHSHANAPSSTALCVQYKGGALFELHKGKRSHVDMEMCRSIVLADVIGKVSAKAHRLANLGAVANDLSGEYSWQCGGVPGLGTDRPVFVIRRVKKKPKPEARQLHYVCCGR